MPFPDVSGWYPAEESARAQFLAAMDPESVASQGYSLPAFYSRDPSTWTDIERWAANENQSAASAAGMSVADYIRYQQTGQPPDGWTREQTSAALLPWSTGRRESLAGGNWLSDTVGNVLTEGAETVGRTGEFLAENPAILFGAPFAVAGALGAFGGAGAGGAGTTAGSGSATVSGSNAFGGAAAGAGGTDLGALISAGMGPQGVVGGAGAGGLATGAAAGGLGAKLLNWLPEITGGVNALLGYDAAKDASEAEVNALNAAIAEQQRQFDLTRSDWQPWMDAGRDALSNLSDPANNFLASPGYEWLRSEGQRDIGNSFSARGGAQSGNALRALAEFQTGLAQQDYGNWYNRELSRAGLGTTGTSNVTAAGQNAANATGNYLSNQGVSRASGVIGRNAAIAGGLNDVVENVLYRRGRRAA